MEELKPGDTLGHYMLKEVMGKGQFGQVWLVEDTSERGKGRQYAMKLEASTLLTPLLKFERNALLRLEEEGTTGFPKVRAFFDCAGFLCMVMTAYGISLDKCRFLMHKHRLLMSHKTLLQLAYQCVMRCKELHDAGYLHRDIKPGNIMLGKASGHRGKGAGLVYFVDFGLVRPWKDFDTHAPLPSTQASRKFKGTVMYCSYRQHALEPCSRRDDIESMCYTLMHLYCRDLPWQVTVEEMRASVAKAKELAMQHKRDLLTDYKAYWEKNAGPGKVCKRAPPAWLSKMAVEAYNTGWDEAPMYDAWCNAILLLAREVYKVKLDHRWDWTPYM